MKRFATAAVCASLTCAVIAPAVAQQQDPNSRPVERKVLAERVCRDGATTTVVLNGDLITVEYFSAPRADGTVSGYEDAYGVREAAEAEAQYRALRCPEGES